MDLLPQSREPVWITLPTVVYSVWAGTHSPEARAVQVVGVELVPTVRKVVVAQAVFVILSILEAQVPTDQLHLSVRLLLLTTEEVVVVD
jgi:hypothetical protein